MDFLPKELLPNVIRQAEIRYAVYFVICCLYDLRYRDFILNDERIWRALMESCSLEPGCNRTLEVWQQFPFYVSKDWFGWDLYKKLGIGKFNRLSMKQKESIAIQHVKCCVLSINPLDDRCVLCLARVGEYVPISWLKQIGLYKQKICTSCYYSTTKHLNLFCDSKYYNRFGIKQAELEALKLPYKFYWKPKRRIEKKLYLKADIDAIASSTNRLKRKPDVTNNKRPRKK